MTITEFLLARIAEDEELAEAAKSVWSGHWATTKCEAYGWRNSRLGAEPALPFVVTDDEHGSLMLADIWPEDGSALTDHVARHDPARVLAECEAKRRIVEHQRELADAWSALGDALDEHDAHVDDEEDDTPLPLTLRALAAVYADHPDFREEWRL